MNCINCNQTFQASGLRCYCNECYKLRRDDLCEFIDSEGKSTIYNQDNITELVLPSHPISIRLDLHGVLDTIDCKEVLPRAAESCCISFVGCTTKTRHGAREDIRSRLGHQVSYGLLVFKRGDRKKKDLYNRFQSVGGKAWINSLIPMPEKAIFIDDSADHVNSVASMKIENLTSHLLKPNEFLLSLIA